MCAQNYFMVTHNINSGRHVTNHSALRCNLHLLNYNNGHISNPAYAQPVAFSTVTVGRLFQIMWLLREFCIQLNKKVQK